MFFKKLSVPKTNETVQKETLVLWVVSWQSRQGAYSSDISKEFEAFSSEEDAKEFKISLENAFKLIRHTSGTKVTIEKR